MSFEILIGKNLHVQQIELIPRLKFSFLSSSQSLEPFLSFIFMYVANRSGDRVKFAKFHTFQRINRESKIVFKFAKFDTFMRRNLESKTSIYIFLCCAIFEEANETLHGNNV